MTIIFKIICFLTMGGLVMVASEIEDYPVSAVLAIGVAAALLIGSLFTILMTGPGRAVFQLIFEGSSGGSNGRQARVWGWAWIAEKARKQTMLLSVVGFTGCITAFVANYNALNYFGPGLTAAFAFLMLGFLMVGTLGWVRNRLSKLARSLGTDVPYDSSILSGAVIGPDILPFGSNGSGIDSAS